MFNAYKYSLRNLESENDNLLIFVEKGLEMTSLTLYSKQYVKA